MSSYFERAWLKSTIDTPEEVDRFFDVSCESFDYTPIRYDQILERMLV